LLPCHSTGLAGQWVGLAWRGSLGFSIMRVHGGAVLAGMWREREVKNKTFLSSPAARSGEEERGTVSFKTTLFWYYYYYYFLT